MQSTELDPALREVLFAQGAADDQAPGRPIPSVPLAQHCNHTPFASQYFQAVDQHAHVFHVVVLRITFDMTRTAADGSLAHAVQQTALATEDAWDGPLNDGSPLWESDFSPFKPRCDVLVANAVSRPPPASRTSTRWPCGVAVQWQDEGLDESGSPPATTSWLKQLAVTGPRRFAVLGLTSPEHAAQVPIDWRLAGGGQIKVPAHDIFNADDSLRTAAGAQRWDVDERNPVGLGLLRSAGAPAPQIERSMDEPFVPGRGAGQPAPALSLGPLARAWQPRRRLAGTYDNDWLRQQWPLPPQDLDFGYWNCAPADQQVPHLPPAAIISLLNLYPPATSPAAAHWPALLDAHGSWRAQLPADEPFVLWRLHSGAMLDLALNLDTLVVDMATLQVYATYRAVISAQAEVRAVETRLALRHLASYSEPHAAAG